MADNFFDTSEQETQEQEVEKINLGGQEYTQEELTKLVGLGKIGLEAETKYHTKLDKVWPQFQSIQGEKKQLQDQLQKEQAIREQLAGNKQPAQPQDPNRQLSQEEIRAAALEQAEQLGIGPKSIQKAVFDLMQGQRLLDDAGKVIDEMTSDGLPETTTDELLVHMTETGIRNPEKAYKDMFEKEWISSQAAKVSQIKQPGMPTISQSTAGQTKQPAPTKITTANFEELFKAALNGGQEL